MKKLIGILLSILTITQAHSLELKKESLLNKISLSLTGRPASTMDQVAISKLSDEGAIQQFINQKIDQYMQTKEYSHKVTYKLYELFQFKNPQSAIYSGDYSAIEKVLPYSTNSLFNSLTQQNLSWDMILTAKKYTLTTNYALQGFVERLSDFDFFSSVADLPHVDASSYDLFAKVPSSSSVTKEIEFDHDDTRISGALTTPPFFSRYSTTGVNKNRRRAAAIFRIFLCDKMSAVIPAAVGIDQALYDILYPKGADAGMTENEVKAILNNSDSIHGSRTDCKSCHYKLDPMGKVFTTSAASLSSMPSPGALVYKNSSGAMVNIPVNGIGEMGQAIVQQDDYVKCQINHFWNWYIGQDVVLTNERMIQLQQAFEKTGRRTNDFTKYILQSKEFATRELPNELRDLSRNVKTYLQRCQSCHSNSADYQGADLTQWPMGKNQNDALDNNRYWITQISEAMDLEHGGIKRTMPPKPVDGGFIPTRKELEMLSLWIKQGAPNEQGHPQIEVKP